VVQSFNRTLASGLLITHRMRWLVPLVLVACTEPVQTLPDGISRSVRAQLRIPGARQIDVLLVIDDSPAMATRREHVGTAVDGLVAALRGGRLRMPDLHVGVTSASSITGLGAFLTDSGRLDGTRVTNYSGTLEVTLREMADVGASGGACARSLEAAQRALAMNHGFRRTAADLVVGVISADDDCSPGDVASYVDMLRAESSVLVAAVTDAAAPRLHELVAAFPNRGSTTALTTSAAEAFRIVHGTGWDTTIEDPCFSAPLADLDPIAPGLQAECTAQLDELPITPCAPGLTAPCFSIAEDERNCPESGLLARLANVDDHRGAVARIECRSEGSR
jgi:hypothetical protein